MSLDYQTPPPTPPDKAEQLRVELACIERAHREIAGDETQAERIAHLERRHAQIVSELPPVHLSAPEPPVATPAEEALAAKESRDAELAANLAAAYTAPPTLFQRIFKGS